MSGGALEVARGPLTAGTGAEGVLRLCGPPLERYWAVAGDVWAAAVWCTVGVPVGDPPGWTRVTERLRVPWPSGRVGAASAVAWFRAASGEDLTPLQVTLRLGVAASAEGFVVAYRLAPFRCPGCGAVTEVAEHAAHGWCPRCRDWTGAAAPRPDQLGRRALSDALERAVA